MIAALHALSLTLLVAPATPRPPFAAADEAVPRALGPVGLAGILVGAAGVGLASAGAVRLAQGPTRTVSPDDREVIIAIDPRPQGRALLGAGLGVAAAGSIALLLDLTVLRSRRARRMALVPVFGPTTAGLLVQGRFEVRPW